MVDVTITNTYGGLSRPNPSKYLNQDGWNYWDGSAWNSSDNTLQVTEGEPLYPDTVTITSNGGAAVSQGSKLGIFQREAQYQNGRPIWKKVGAQVYIYFSGKQLFSFEFVKFCIGQSIVLLVCTCLGVNFCFVCLRTRG